ncbi:Spore coat protein CotH [Petrocella atlantisensis]|uniref:Spore coat protein CotH n=1 Tax=Petrocella atlantisensis TaxID=2173034 RepID=A0A3P7RYI9_9FIRM|nr:CotH kinase family protein [Petrocella atlantisensis]VDN47632.1 Spore coat protein CotH [Petrocella atlantisensis]
MIKSKYIHWIVMMATVMALGISTLLIGYAFDTTSSESVTMDYADFVFNGDVISLDIIADPTAWSTMLENATAETYIMVDVVINGKEIKNVGIRPKGNSSLSQVARDDTSDRFSFRLKFDQYIKGQTFMGLDTMVMNNMIGDNSYMKEYLSYDIMAYMEVDTPLYGFTDVSVNGETWGFYLAVELYDDSYQSRVYGNTSGNLYNVKSMDIGSNHMDANQAQRPQGNTSSSGSAVVMNPGMQDARTREGVVSDEFIPKRGEGVEGREGIVGRGMGMGNNGNTGGDLKYTDDLMTSYAAIFENGVGKIGESDQKKVIEALKHLQEGEELEKYWDVDVILRYMAAHTVVVNLDSYSSNMAQNYYIYENDGKLTILPWDYNLAFGGFSSNSMTEVVNFPIDTPVSGVTMEERPLFNILLSQETYKATYHEYLETIVSDYLKQGQWAKKIETLDQLIGVYVEKDPSAFCTYEEYKQAIDTLTNLGTLRSESILGQLEGAIPSTNTTQETAKEKLIQADHLSIEDLGSMGGGGNSGKMAIFDQAKTD